jgi:hypothetical protein
LAWVEADGCIEGPSGIAGWQVLGIALPHQHVAETVKLIAANLLPRLVRNSQRALQIILVNESQGSSRRGQGQGLIDTRVQEGLQWLEALRQLRDHIVAITEVMLALAVLFAP